MITRREDLHDTWVDVTKDHGVVKLFSAIYDTDALFGREISKPYNELVGREPCVAISIDSRGGWTKHADKPSHSTLREVTMKDFISSNDVKYYNKDEEIKPQEKINHKWERFQDCYAKTEEELMSDNSALDKAVKEVTEFVRVEDTIFELRDEFNHGKLYTLRDGAIDDYIKIDEESTLMIELGRGLVFREVNRVATWVDYAMELIWTIDKEKGSLIYNLRDMIINDPEIVLKLSHLIASITDKPR